MPLEITKSFYFDAAHFLPNLPSNHKCRRLHGHTFKVDISIEGDVNKETGWVRDFQEIKNAFEPVLEIMDHNFLNQIQGLENPTSETIAKFIWEKINPDLPNLSKIVIYETPLSKCTYYGEKSSYTEDSNKRKTLRVSAQNHKHNIGIWLGREGLYFNSAHFLIYENKTRDRIHGHSYSCEIEIYGELQKDGIIMDFRILKNKLGKLHTLLNNSILIAEKNPFLKIMKNEENLIIKLFEEKFEFPEKDCVLLPLENTSTELLSKYICDEVVNEIKNCFYSLNSALIKVKLGEGIGIEGSICEKKIV